MEIELDKNGRLLRPGFHDGYLLGVELVSKGEATVKLRKLSGERYNLDLLGVERLLCNEFAEGNIVSEIFLMSGIAPPLGSLRLLLAAPHESAAEEYHNGYEAIVRQKGELIQQGKLTLVAIVPSYGCELHALCRSVEITVQQT